MEDAETIFKGGAGLIIKPKVYENIFERKPTADFCKILQNCLNQRGIKVLTPPFLRPPNYIYILLEERNHCIQIGGMWLTQRRINLFISLRRIFSSGCVAV